MAKAGKIGEFEKGILEFAKSHEFSTFWLAAILSYPMEKDLSEEGRVKLKAEIKRGLGQKLEKKWKKKGIKAVHDEPDVLFTLNFHNGQLRVKARPLLVFGRYTKPSREIPQSKWPCRKCHGSGCDYCKGKGAMYVETVEGFLAAPLLKASGGKSTKLHSVGREDIDARMLGEGRPFIIEVGNPPKRKIDLVKIAKEANKVAAGKAGFSELSFATETELVALNAAQPDKTYSLKVECASPVSDAGLKKLLKLKGKTISQNTPTRVLHRRADLLRKRKVRKVSVERTGPKSFILTLTVQSGTYIKELVSGDKGRTKPNVSEILGCICKPRELDVLAVGFSRE